MLFRYTAPGELAMIEPPKFCSECGERLNARRARLSRWRTACLRCAPRSRARRLWKSLSLALLVFAAFAVGRYGAPPRTVYLLGTPIEPLAAAAPSAAAPAGTSFNGRATGAVNSTGDEAVSICGAPTKSGKPCQRKVKGGGYCYQHRDKYGQKNASRNSQ
jgi:hypothetical protein